MWRRCQCAVVKPRLVDKASDVTGELGGTGVTATKVNEVPIVRDIGIARIDRRAVVELGIHHNVRLVVAGAGEEICSFFTHVVGKAEIGVAIASVKLKPTKSVDQKDVDYTRHGVGAVNGGSPVLQDVDVINQPKRKHVEIDRITGETDWR